MGFFRVDFSLRIIPLEKSFGKETSKKGSKRGFKFSRN
jgi:hypothetical protein